MNYNTLQLKKTAGLILAVIFAFAGLTAEGQSDEYNYYYRVYFNDKGTYTPESFSPSSLLSPKALERREKSGITAPDFHDLPVFTEYISQVNSLGFKLHCTSKWMNTALFKTMEEADLSPVLSLPFVADVKLVKTPAPKSLHSDKLDFPRSTADPPPYDRPITMVNGYSLHNAGYDGTGVLIAVLDGGFIYADAATSLAGLRNRNGIKHTRDFVLNNPFVYSFHNHGTAVLSVLAGQIPGLIRGTAPGADFLLLRTEDGSSEFPVEEDFWTAGAEFADSAGADIISSSLGYCTFDDPGMNYKFSDLDGNTAFVTRAADVAASKGILVVNSAGNERNNPWIRIIAPSDGDSVVASGAVDGSNMISVFSSAGPSADGQVKPDISTLGVSIIVQSSATLLARSSGTSFSCPVLSGMTACLMEAVPEADNIQIIEALHASADRYNSPDSLYGYGIPDMAKALTLLQDIYLFIPDRESVTGPNPTMGDFEIIFKESQERIKIEIINSSGVMIFNKDFGFYAGRSLRITALNNRPQGLYFLRLTTGKGKYTYKIIKLHNR